MRVLILTGIIVVLDQITKLLVKGFNLPFLNLNFEGMNYGQSIKIIGNFFKLTFVENPGMAFGIDFGGTSKLYLSLFSVFASIGLFYYIYKIRKDNLLFRVSLALILGGAVGNLIDRVFYGIAYGYAPLFYGKVVDFFNVDFFDFTIFGHTYERWPIFNIADASVTVGVFILIFFHKKIESHQNEKKETEEKSDSTPSFQENIN